MVPCQPAAGNDTVHMYMIKELLVPCMEYLYDAGGRAEELIVGGKFQKSFGTASMKETIEELLIMIEQRSQFMWRRENNVEVRGVDHFRAAFIDPDLFLYGLAAGTVTVTAGIIVYFCVAAVRAYADIAAKFSGLTVKDGAGSFPLDLGLEMSGSVKLPIGKLPYPPDLQVSHEGHLRSDQMD